MAEVVSSFKFIHMNNEGKTFLCKLLLLKFVCSSGLNLLNMCYFYLGYAVEDFLLYFTLLLYFEALGLAIPIPS